MLGINNLICRYILLQMQTVTVQTTQNIDIEYEVATLGDRILARLIDIVFYVALALVFVIIGAAASFNNILSITLFVIYLIVFAFYDLICEIFFNGQCFGKRIMKIKVVSLDGARPSISQYLLRWLFRIVDFSLTSGLCALIAVAVSSKKQRVGDIVAGTTLVKTEPRTKIDSLVFMPSAEEYTPVFDSAKDLTNEELTLINEVVADHNKTGNSVLTYNLALRIMQSLNVSKPGDMDDLQFLRTLIKDHNYFTTSHGVYVPVFTNVAQLSDSDVALIHEVLTNYSKSHNHGLITNMADRVRKHLGITQPEGMKDQQFLVTIIKDYRHITAGMSV